MSAKLTSSDKPGKSKPKKAHKEHEETELTKRDLLIMIAVITTIVLVLATLLFGLQWLTLLESLVRSLPVMTFAMLGLGVLYLLGAGTQQQRGWLFAIVITIAVGYTITFHNYLVSNAFAQQVTTDEQSVTSFENRVPWVVANNYASRDQGDDVGDRGNVKYVPAGEKQIYSTLITGRSLFGNVGYSSIREFALPEVGAIPANAAQSCQVPDEMGQRWGAYLPWRSLDYSISWRAPFTHYDYADTYGYCLKGQPVVVQPLWKYAGFFVSVKVPAGVAVYDAQGLRILSATELESEGILGPTYPQSLARTQRESLIASGSFMDFLASRSGYDTTEKDKEDSNAGNTSEFLLVDTSGKLQYVTPLTPRGSSQSIVANFVAPAQQFAQQPQARIETSVDLPATSSLENAIRSASVPADPEWSTRWAAGMRVYEIIPTAEGNWVASIGLGQEVNYRALIKTDGSISVQRTDQAGGGSPTQEQPGTGSVMGISVDLQKLSKAELVDLIHRASQELANR